MTQRSEQDCRQEIQDTSSAHIENEAQRDAFVSLGHTALFASSIAFIGDVARPGEAIFLNVLYASWTSSVVGLLALTASFEFAKRSTDLQRESIFLPDFKPSALADVSNRIALWTFPVSLLCLALFAAINIGKS